MSELTVGDVVFALEQLQIDVDPVLLRRIEWSLGSGNSQWPEERLKEQLSDFVLRRSRSKYFLTSEISLDDFLCEQGISLAQYRQLMKSLDTLSNDRPFLSSLAVEDFDNDSSVLKYAQHYSDQYVILEKLRDLGLSHIQCKAILGLGAKSYERLRKRIHDHRKEEVSRTGRSENDAWSFAKHVISEFCLKQFKESIDQPLFVLETHQGIGGATFLYRKYGHVLGFDNHRETHEVLLERAKSSGFYCNARDLYFRRQSFDPRTADPYVFLTEEPVSSEDGLQMLIKQGLYFDVVDVDPFTTSKPYFADVLKVISDPGLIMITLGDQHPWPKGETAAWERFEVDLYNVALTEATKQNWRRNWMFLRRACAWYMYTAAASSVCLLPILLMRNFEPWASRIDFPKGVMGIDRIYFLSKRVSDADKLDKVFQSWTEPLPFLEEVMLRDEVTSHICLSGVLSFLSFTNEIWPRMRPFWADYQEWLTVTANDLASRWHSTETTAFDAVRYSMEQSILQVCGEVVVRGFRLADSWLRNL